MNQTKYDVEAVRAGFDLIAYASKFTTLNSKNGEYWGKCPLHQDSDPSFHVNAQGTEWYCFSEAIGGDAFDFVAQVNRLDIKTDFTQICAIMGGAEYSLDPQERQRREALPKTPERVSVSPEQMQVIWQNGERYEATNMYQYADELIKIRYETADGKKSFRWYHSEDGTYYYGKGGKKNGLYWQGDKTAERVFIVEGEKSCEALASCGYTVCTASDGADPQASKWLPEYSEELRDKDVVIINDDDWDKEINLGETYANIVAFKVQDFAKTVCRISPNQIHENIERISGYDIADAVQRVGAVRTKEAIDQLIANSQPTILTLEPMSEDELINEFIYSAADIWIKEGLTDFNFKLEEKFAALPKGHPGKPAIKKAVKEVVTKRKLEKAKTLEVVDASRNSISLGNVDWSLDGTGYGCQDGMLIDETGSMIVPQKVVYAADVLDVETGYHRDMLMFNKVNAPNMVFTQTFATEDLRSAQRTVSAVSKYGIDLESTTASQFCKYIIAMKAKQGVDMRQIREINRIGWYRDCLLPYEAESAEVVVRQGEVDSKIAEAFAAQAGDKEKSLELVQDVLRKVSIAPIVLGTIVSSLFMEKIGRQGQTHVLNISGQSGWGKTKLVDCLYSLFGNSVEHHMYGGSDATVQSGQNKAGYLRNFALYLDDPLQASKEDKATAQQRIYSLVSGQGRQRNNRDGQSREFKEWYCNMLYSNEAPLYADDERVKGGVLNRILDIEIEAEIPHEQIVEWVDIISKHHGHFGKDFAESIRKFSADHINMMINAQYERFHNMGVDNKRGNTAAAIAVGYSFAQDVLGIRDEFPYEIVAKNVNRAGEISDGARTWKRFKEWLNGSIQMFRIQTDPRGACWGALNYGKNGKIIGVQKDKLSEICRERSWRKDLLVKYCEENGYIDKEIETIYAGGNSNAQVVAFYYDWDEPMNFNKGDYYGD